MNQSSKMMMSKKRVTRQGEEIEAKEDDDRERVNVERATRSKERVSERARADDESVCVREREREAGKRAMREREN